MYIMLIKVYYSSFSAFTACMFDWLIDGRSLDKTKLDHLINSVCFRVQSVTKTASQRKHQRSSMLFQRWYLVENESWADVHLSTLFQRWQNNVETTLIELRRFNVDEPTLF